MKKVVIFGSTGSIGTNTCAIIAENPSRFKAVGLACKSRVKLLIEQAQILKPKIVAVFDESAAQKAKESLKNIKVLSGMDGLLELAAMKGYDTLVSSIVGQIGLLPTYTAIKSGKQICLANKETLVAAGEIMMDAVKQSGKILLPVDSEHSAIFQCLKSEDPSHILKLILTASGGPFLNTPAEKFAGITPAQALKHPNWNMGGKITIDSATLMNKGLEIIEARWLFDIPFSKIDVVVHPQSIIHSMVEYVDGSTIAQLGMPDMKLPIQYALTYPDRAKVEGIEPLSLTKIGKLTFFEPDERFPCLKIAINAGIQGKTFPAVMNAANEVAVENFLAQQIGFSDIPAVISAVVNAHKPHYKGTIECILKADEWARKQAGMEVEKCAKPVK